MLSNDARISLAEATAAYADHLSRDCEAYLNDRGIPVDEWHNPWMFGYVHQPMMPEHERYVGMLAIPYLVPHGGPVGMKFRSLPGSENEGGRKYRSHPGMGTHLFGVINFGIDSPIFGITEGELDAVVATEAGIPSVAVPGASSWQREWRYLFEGYRTVAVFGDGDGSGREFARDVAFSVPNARAIGMPDGHDVTSLVVDEGPEALRERVGL